MKNLKSLYLGNQNITDQGIKYLMTMTQLSTLALWETSVTKEGIQILINSLPHLKPLDDRLVTTKGTFLFVEQPL